MNAEAITQKILRRSILFVLIISILGLGIGFWTSSQVIIFDGITNLVGVTFTSLGLITIKYIRKQNLKTFPYGKEALEPLLALVQFSILLFICISNIVTAVQVLFVGGNAVNIHTGLLFGLLSTMIKLGACIYLASLSKKIISPLADAEVLGWKLEVAIGVSILLGFLVSVIFTAINLTTLVPYIDPVLTIIASLIFTFITIIAVQDSIKELMQARPPEEIYCTVIEKVDSVNLNDKVTDKIVRVGKTGSKIMIDVSYVVEEESQLDSISEQDGVRKQLIQLFADLPYRARLNVTFTADAKLADK